VVGSLVGDVVGGRCCWRSHSTPPHFAVRALRTLVAHALRAFTLQPCLFIAPGAQPFIWIRCIRSPFLAVTLVGVAFCLTFIWDTVLIPEQALRCCLFRLRVDLVCVGFVGLSWMPGRRVCRTTPRVRTLPALYCTCLYLCARAHSARHARARAWTLPCFLVPLACAHAWLVTALPVMPCHAFCSALLVR